MVIIRTSESQKPDNRDSLPFPCGLCIASFPLREPSFPCTESYYVVSPGVLRVSARDSTNLVDAHRVPIPLHPTIARIRYRRLLTYLSLGKRYPTPSLNLRYYCYFLMPMTLGVFCDLLPYLLRSTYQTDCKVFPRSKMVPRDPKHDADHRFGKDMTIQTFNLLYHR